jgi:methyl-accepting chemotaxis protein
MTSLKRNIAAIGMIVALAVLIANAWVCYHSTVALNDRDRWVEHTQTVITQLLGTQASSSDALSQLRAYFLSGSEDVLAPSRQSSAAALEHATRVAELTSDSTERHQRAEDLRKTVKKSWWSFRRPVRRWSISASLFLK